MSRSKTLVVLLLCVCLILVGCSSSSVDSKGNPEVSAQQVQQEEKELTSQEPSSSAASVGEGKSSQKSREPGVRASDTVPEATTAEAPQTTMALEDTEMDRLRQNGPTRAERKRRRYRKAAPINVSRKHVPGDNGAPVFADPIETVPVDPQEGQT